MRLVLSLMAFFCVSGVLAAEEMRTWTSVKGSRLEAAFVEQRGTAVVLRCKDGQEVTPQLADLCEADRAYVKEATYVPRDVVAVFRSQRGGLDRVFEESGTSEAASLRDTVTIRVIHRRGEDKGEEVGDSRWKIESVDVFGNRVPARQQGMAVDLVTEGKFVFVTYFVENDANVPISVPSPILIDKRGRKFLQAARANAQMYLPENALFAGVDTVQPGFRKLFCAFYELPADGEPAMVEVFPSRTSSFYIERFEVKGKQIRVDGGAPAAASGAAADAPAAVAGKKVPVFMKCVRVGQGGDTSSLWYYDRSKKRSLSYGLELRGIGEQAGPVTVNVKAFFIGAISGNRDVVVDKKQEDVVLEPGKISRIVLQSKDVEESTYFYYSGTQISGAKLKGVIVQVWSGGSVTASFVSLNQWKKFAEEADVVKQMGELVVTEREL
jgi:hypothetical protein